MDGEYESFFQAYSFSAMTKMFKSKKSSPSKGDAQTATTLLIKPSPWLLGVIKNSRRWQQDKTASNSFLASFKVGVF